MRQKIQSGFEQEAALLQKVAKLSPEERKKWLDDNKGVDPLVSDSRILGGIGLLGEALSPEVQAQLLRGETSPTVQVDQLSPEAQAFIKQEQELAQPGGSLPTKVRFMTMHDRDGVAPTLYINLDGLGGYGYVGGSPMSHKIYEDLTANWLLPGDDPHDALGTHFVSVPEKLRQSTSLVGTTQEELSSLTPKQFSTFTQQLQHVTENEFLQLAVGTPLSFIANIPTKQQYYGSPHEKSVDQYLKILAKSSPKIISKWRTHMLLLSHPGRFLQSNNDVPWEKIKILQQKLTPEMSLAQLIKTVEVSRITDEQVVRLSHDLPILETVIAQRPWLSLYMHFPEVATPQGLRLTPENIPILQGLTHSSVQNDWSNAVFLRMTEKQEITKDYYGNRVSRHTVDFTFCTQDLKTITGGGFFYEKSIEDESKLNSH